MSKDNSKRKLSEKEIRRFRARREICFAILFEMTFTDDTAEEILENAKISGVINSIYTDNKTAEHSDDNPVVSDSDIQGENEQGDQNEYPNEDKYILHMLNLFVENKDEVDDTISKYIKGWTIDRLSRVTLSVLRFAVTELKYTDTSEKVAINEAVELSKKYSTPNDARFVNGVLGSVAKELQE